MYAGLGFFLQVRVSRAASRAKQLGSQPARQTIGVSKRAVRPRLLRPRAGSAGIQHRRTPPSNASVLSRVLCFKFQHSEYTNRQISWCGDVDDPLYYLELFRRRRNKKCEQTISDSTARLPCKISSLIKRPRVFGDNGDDQRKIPNYLLTIFLRL